MFYLYLDGIDGCFDDLIIKVNHVIYMLSSVKFSKRIIFVYIKQISYERRFSSSYFLIYKRKCHHVYTTSFLSYSYVEISKMGYHSLIHDWNVFDDVFF